MDHGQRDTGVTAAIAPGTMTVPAINPLALPNDRNRYAILARAAGTPPYFDRRIGSWIVLDPALVSELLVDERLVLPDVEAAITAVEARYRLRLDEMRSLARDIPLLIDGTHHQEIRGAMARLLSARRRPVRESNAATAATLTKRLGAGGRFDLFAEVLRPALSDFFASLLGLRIDFAPLTITRIFDRHLTIQQLQGVEDGIAAIRRLVKPLVTPEYSENVIIGIIMLGRDSLLGSISDSTIQLFNEHMDRRLDDPEIPAPKLNGAVAIAERITADSLPIAGVVFGQGERVRLFYQGYNLFESDTARLGGFGAGAHSCLGRPHSLDFWSALAEAIKSVPRTVCGLDFENDRSPIFYMPKSIWVELE